LKKKKESEEKKFEIDKDNPNLLTYKINEYTIYIEMGAKGLIIRTYYLDSEDGVSKIVYSHSVGFAQMGLGIGFDKKLA
jgi:hypothetical protein